MPVRKAESKIDAEVVNTKKPPTESLEVKTLQSLVHDVQEAYFKKHSQYWQSPKAKTSETEAITGSTSWKDEGIDPQAADEGIEVHIYTGPKGSGYIIYTSKVAEGGVWMKIDAVSAESERTKDWHFIPNEK